MLKKLGELRLLVLEERNPESMRIAIQEVVDKLNELIRSHNYQLPSISDDRGDSSGSINVRRDDEIQLWATNLTVNRAVTLDVLRATDGDHVTILRTGLGPGTLDVGGLKTIPAATKARVDVMFDNGAWVLVGYQLL